MPAVPSAEMAANSQRSFVAIGCQTNGTIKALTNALARMNAYGVLGAYLPTFGAIIGQMQHDLFHVYTVDAHSLFVVRNLRRFALDKHKENVSNQDNIAKITKNMENLTTQPVR